jgi:plasmid stabilization system protein ParE
MAEVLWTVSAETSFQELYQEMEDYSPGRGERFEIALDHALELLRNNPEIGSRERGPVRRLLVHEFSVGVFYTFSSPRVIVHSILNLRLPPHILAWQLDRIIRSVTPPE